MLNYNAIRAVLSEPWFISYSAAEQLSFLIYNLLTPNLEFAPLSSDAREGLAYTKVINSVGVSGKSVTKNIGVITIRGALTKYDSLCAIGMESYTSMVKSYDSNPNIDAIVLDFDSPGGSVNGTEEFASVVKSTQKPTIAFVNDLTASAAYWVASACDKIIANNTTAQVGSIGAMCSWLDLKDYYAKQGIRPISIYAPQSTDKNKENRLAENGDYSLIQYQLKILAAKFISSVEQNRPSVLKKQLTGSIYFAGDVVGSLVDSIGTIETAISVAGSLTRNYKSLIKKNINMGKQHYPTLAKVLGVDAIESVDGSISLTEEQATAIETALTSISSNNDVQSKNSQLEGALSTANTNLAAAVSTIKSLNEKLALKPGAESAVASPATDSTSQSKVIGDSFFEAMNEAAKYL